MKKLAFILIAAALFFSINLSASTTENTAAEEMTCVWDSWFKYPQHNAKIAEGKHVYVRVDPKQKHHIASMELFINGRFIRKENNYPYEWAKQGGSGDPVLRNLRPGTYKLKVKIQDRCGRYNEKYCVFYVIGRNQHPLPSQCEWDSWFKSPKENATYPSGKDVYVRVEPKNRHHIEHMELYINGRFIRKESSYPFEWAKQGTRGDEYLRNMKPGSYKLKVRFKDKCGQYHEKYCVFHVKGHHPNPQPSRCEWESWYKHPKNGASYPAGKDLYVRVEPKNQHHIEYMELYVNGKFVRKENTYPYEWAKGSGSADHYLRNMKSGTYKLTVRIKDKCGKLNEKHCVIYVKGHQNPGHCQWDAWFKYPRNNGTYKYGSDVYVRVDAKNYQSIAHMELYVNGKFVRKENSYPYEWCKGQGNGDGYLRKLKRGTYKLKIKIKDKCGQYREKYCTFYVR